MWAWEPSAACWDPGLHAPGPEQRVLPEEPTGVIPRGGVCEATVFDVKRFLMIRKLPHCSPRGWLRDRPDRALTGRAITYDRVEDCQQLAGDRDQADLLGLACCYEALEEGLEHGVVPLGHDGAYEEGCTHARPATTDEALAAPLARLA